MYLIFSALIVIKTTPQYEHSAMIFGVYSMLKSFNCTSNFHLNGHTLYLEFSHDPQKQQLQQSFTAL